MGDPSAKIWTALNGGVSPVAVVLYGDLGLRASAAEEVASVAHPGWPIVRAATVAEALAHPDSLVLLQPRDERAAIEDFEGLRDAFLGRAYPVVLFLLRDGDGVAALRTAASLASWIRGSDVDPERDAQIDDAEERASFEAATGQTPEEWLAAHADPPADGSDIGRRYRAMLLARR